MGSELVGLHLKGELWAAVHHPQELVTPEGQSLQVSMAWKAGLRERKAGSRGQVRELRGPADRVCVLASSVLVPRPSLARPLLPPAGKAAPSASSRSAASTEDPGLGSPEASVSHS